MKKVLILAYDFPPLNTIGAKRPYSWFLFFKKFDWEPIVITKNWKRNIYTASELYESTIEQNVISEESDLGKIIRVPFKKNINDRLINSNLKILRKIITFIFSILQYQFFLFDNKKYIYKEAKDFLKDNKCIFIIPTGEPYVLFRYARKLSKKYNIPWIADYRDGWSTNSHPNIVESRIKRIQNNIFQLLEKKIVKSAVGITTAAEEYSIELKRIFPNKPIHVILNGYLLEEFSKCTDKQNEDIFTISYIGTIYPFQRIDVFFDGLSEFIIRSNAKIQVNFYGSRFYDIEKNIGIKNDIRDYLNFIIRQDMKEILPEISKSNLLLLLGSQENKSLFAKIFDYIMLNRKILFVNNDFGPLEKIIVETDSGIICNNKEEVCFNIESLYNEWETFGIVKSETKNIEKYSREFQTKRMVDILDDLLVLEKNSL